MTDDSHGFAYGRVCIIGLGLIGSSFARAARRGQAAGTLVGYDVSPEVRSRAGTLGFCDEIAETIGEAVSGADLIVLCVPVGAVGAIAESMAPYVSAGATITDTGSVKADVVSAMAPFIPGKAHFIPGHPLAGTEHSGPEAGFAALFDGRWSILTPLPGTEEAPLAKLSAFWEALGARVATMTPEHHDMVLAVTSHVPHAIAFTMVGVADDLARVTDSEVVQFSAAGFRDFTRIAASDPVMWRDVFLHNKEATLDILGRFTEELFELRRAIRTDDGDWLKDYFTRTRAIRRGIIEAGQDTASPDFGRLEKLQASESQGGQTPSVAAKADGCSGDQA